MNPVRTLMGDADRINRNLAMIIRFINMNVNDIERL